MNGYLIAAYVLGLGILWSYAVWICLATHALNRRGKRRNAP